MLGRSPGGCITRPMVHVSGGKRYRHPHWRAGVDLYRSAPRLFNSSRTRFFCVAPSCLDISSYTGRGCSREGETG